MRPSVEDQSYLLDMLRHARGVNDAVQGLTFEQYAADENLRLAVERRIEIIGEAARRVTRRLQEAHAAIPWQKIVAQRHVLAHEYGEIEDELIWRVSTMHIPELIRQLEAILKQGE